MSGVGTLRWQAPELWDGAHKSFASDMYALAMTIVEVSPCYILRCTVLISFRCNPNTLTSAMPFPELQNDTAVMMKVLGGSKPPLYPEVSPIGENLKNGWVAAKVCWAQEIGERPPITQVIDFLTGGPTGIVLDFNEAQHADRFIHLSEITLPRKVSSHSCNF